MRKAQFVETFQAGRLEINIQADEPASEATSAAGGESQATININVNMAMAPPDGDLGRLSTAKKSPKASNVTINVNVNTAMTPPDGDLRRL